MNSSDEEWSILGRLQVAGQMLADAKAGKPHIAISSDEQMSRAVRAVNDAVNQFEEWYEIDYGIRIGELIA